MSNEIIVTESLTKTFFTSNSEVLAVNNIDVSFQLGEFTVIMGASGAGKSTFLNLISGLEIPDSGNITINDIEFSSMTSQERTLFRRNNIAVIYQFHNLHSLLTIEENLELPLLINGTPKEKRYDLITQQLKRIFLDSSRKNYPDELSGGEQQRVAIARALITNPKILLCDEPTGNLDFDWGIKIIDLLHSLNKKNNITLIMVTHDDELLRKGDRVIYFDDGKIIKDYAIS